MTVCPLTAIVVISSAGGAAATASAAAFFREVRWPPFGGGAGSGAGASFGGWFAGAAGASAVGMEFEAAAGTAGCSSSAASTSSAAPASAAASATAFFCAARLPPLGVGAVTRAGAWPAPSSRSTTAAGPEQPEAPEEPPKDLFPSAFALSASAFFRAARFPPEGATSAAGCSCTAGSTSACSGSSTFGLLGASQTKLKPAEAMAPMRRGRRPNAPFADRIEGITFTTLARTRNASVRMCLLL
mmetsp:Transcript_123836/g.396406  ORF Transcript_123836/g.396406 Transcript_123836/m.396406 type:complete len:243 (-) Transcript_123836:941-1669(-)